MSKSVVLVESPAKAKTISRYLGDGFHVLATYGHIRDLPSRNGSVDPSNAFSMIWEMDERGKKHFDLIKKAVKGANTLYLATDPDREGEAISWHVYEALKEEKLLSKVEVQRIVFHEITPGAIRHALGDPRNINQSLVEAYLARRALDYLVGFTLSPVLWRKLPGARSAGRVQSVALRLIVEREQDIQRFQTQEYWTIESTFINEKNVPFSSHLTVAEGNKLEKFSIPNEQEAARLLKLLEPLSFSVSSVEKKQVRRKPSPPFMTSTLQQEASRKLGFGASRTMQTAQKLYEGLEIDGELVGLITYMRTDSTHLSQDALKDMRKLIQSLYGVDYLPKTPREFKKKVKNAQEAHEAIRPTSTSLRPDQVKSYLNSDQFRLYELIWKRALASQMEDALFDQVSVDVASPKKDFIFRATGSTLVFDGFLRIYQEGKDTEDDDDKESRLPALSEKEAVTSSDITPSQHFTQPPPRYTEASLVKKLEELGIGRPSTYASLIQVLQDRSYVRLDKKVFTPEAIGHLVTSFLTLFFNKYVEYDFTAQMEEALDNISASETSWIDILSEFWEGFSKTIDQSTTLNFSDIIPQLENALEDFLFSNGRTCPACKEGTLGLKLGKFGAFLGCSRYPDCRETQKFLAHDAAEASFVKEDDIVLGRDPETQQNILLKKGPYGRYLEWENSQDESSKPAPKKTKKGKETTKKNTTKRVRIPSHVSAEEVTLDLALQLKKIPRVLGVHPETSTSIELLNGPYGPYLKYQTQSISLARHKKDFWTLTLDEALPIIEQKLANPKPTRGSIKKKKTSE